MTLPDTFAGGKFDLPLTVAKMVRLAESTNSAQEKDTARRQLWKRGFFLDRVGILWDNDVVPTIARDDLWQELSS